MAKRKRQSPKLDFKLPPNLKLPREPKPRLKAIHSFEEQLVEELGEYSFDPLGFAEFAYEWQEKELQESEGPREWQAAILAHIGAHLADEETRHTPCRIAVSSGHGIGKSALIGMILDWCLSTCEDARAIVTANTNTQLATKTVPEVTKWFRRSINHHWFQTAATSIKASDEKREKTWRADFIPWSEQNPDAFAGLHNKGKRILLVFDEASGIAPTIWETAEGALTDENTEIIWLAFGNPIRNSGRFYECFGSQKHRWRTYQIDARNVQGTNKQQIEQWIADYGEDSDFVRVRVRGEFPRSGSSQFISSDVVAIARKYKAVGYGDLPRILSVDVARFGDDQTVIGWRQGRRFTILGKFREKDTVWVAEQTIRYIESEKPDAIVVDGDGLGAGVVDQINHRGFGRHLFEFHGGATANDGSAYFNRRAEVWGAARDWLANAEIPDDPELAADLTGVEFGFSSKNQIQLEKKEELKKRGLASPDCGDCLAMTFAVHVLPKPKEEPVKYVWPGENALSWMSGLLPISFEMTRHTQPHHIKPELLLIALVMMCLYLALRVALRAGFWANKDSIANSSAHCSTRFPFRRIGSIRSFVVCEYCFAVLKIPAAAIRFLALRMRIPMLGFESQPSRTFPPRFLSSLAMLYSLGPVFLNRGYASGTFTPCSYICIPFSALFAQLFGSHNGIVSR